MKKFKIGDVFFNSRGAVVVITTPTKAGNPQYYIAASSEHYIKGIFECRGTNTEEDLEGILNQNHYVKINS